jgi:hypothetical protein
MMGRGYYVVDAAKDVRRNLNIYECSKKTDDIKCSWIDPVGKMDGEMYEKRS